MLDENVIGNLCAYVRESGILKDAKVVGIGTGRTISGTLTCLGPEALIDKVVVASSIETQLVLKSLGIPSASPISVDKLEVYIDSADYVSPGLAAIKGGGGAMTMEKLLASNSRLVVILVDESKVTDNLLGNPIPIEVIPAAISFVKRRLRELGLTAEERSPQRGKRPPVISDLGGAILDVRAEGWTEGLEELERTIRAIPGVVETGIFVNMIDVLVIGGPKGVKAVSRGMTIPEASER